MHCFGGTSFFQAAAWVVAQLADGLQHAHNRGILHRDIKPSNILISDEGQPLLLDFNLAQDQRLPAEQAAVGGTIAYMAPEHLRAMIGQAPAADGGPEIRCVLAGHGPRRDAHRRQSLW